MTNNLFMGYRVTGITYCDKRIEEYGDYKKVAFVPYVTATLELRPDCPDDLKDIIIKDAAQYKAGQRLQISSTGQTVLLGAI